MKNLACIIFVLAFSMLYSCSTTEEATSTKNNPNLVQMQQWQEQEQRRQEAGERSGLSQDEMKVLNDYAETKGELACQLQELQKSSEAAMSDQAQADIKNMIIEIENELIPITQEIDQYCSTEPRKRYFHHVYKNIVENCQ